MYSYIIGRITAKGEGSLVLECGGIGYDICVSANTLFNLQADTVVKVYTHLAVREDSHTLYGFETAEERTVFLRLTGVSGIGPKVALAILSGVSVADLATAIVTGNILLLSSIKGVGKKTAERIVLELKEKIELPDKAARQTGSAVGTDAVFDEAVLALMTLGIGRAEAAKAVTAVRPQADNVERVIMLALKGLK